MFRSIITGFTASALLTSIVVYDASAQDEYDLTEDDSWLLTSTPDAGSPAGLLAAARKVLASGEFARAGELADSWIEEHENHELMPLAVLTRGDALFGQKYYYQSLFDYEAVARLYAHSDVFITALKRELVIAKLYAHGLRRIMWGMRIADASDEAEELLIRIQERLPGSNLAEEAGIELGDFYFRNREMSLAVDAYDLFVENYPDSDLIIKAQRRLIAAHLASFKGPEFDSTGLSDARQRLVELRATEPAAAEQLGAEALVAGIDERAATKMLSTAEWYYTTGDPVAAEFTIRRMLVKYENTLAASNALKIIDQILMEMPQQMRENVDNFYSEKKAASAVFKELSSSSESTGKDLATETNDDGENSP